MPLLIMIHRCFVSRNVNLLVRAFYSNELNDDDDDNNNEYTMHTKLNDAEQERVNDYWLPATE